MCGFIGYSVPEDINRDLIDFKFKNYFNKLNHRGPDYSETITYNKNKQFYKFGFCRLSIQDLDKKANKIFKDDSLCLLFNGEIYNKQDIIKKYFSNFKFETNTDTEVLFNLIKKFGYQKINEIEGIYSIVYYELKKNKITLARDYTGTKPLYYLIDNDKIYFSSEAWFLYSISKKKIDINACNFYFRFGFPPQEKSLITDVHKVKPNSIIEYNIKEKNLTGKELITNLGSCSIKEDNLNFKELISKSIKKNLIGNRNIGVYLSGGIDSTIISLETKKFNEKIEAYTSIYEGSNNENNEDYEISKKLCKDNNIKLNVSLIRQKEMLEGEEFINAANYFDEPIANLNFFSSFKQAQHAKENNTAVVLTGDGADEIFGGYRKYQTLEIAKKLDFLSPFYSKLREYKKLNNKNTPFYFSKKIGDKFLKKVFKEKFSYLLTKNNNHEFLSEKFNSKLSNLNYFDFKYWLVDEHNLKLDRSTMANSIEGRVPFQDITILKNFSCHNISNKFTFYKNKLQLREAFKDLPNYVLNRKKRGWFLPETSFLNDFLKKNIFEIFSIEDYDTNYIFNYKKIYEIYFTQSIFKFPRYEFITILMFKLWLNKVMKC